mmetsp:Transcript_24113/g.90990  ORF Transcript_24113/g.90990 Transcript_24113/m.90990 type:complete len:324 (-) Transcript_24113:1049-2020(-)
MLPLTAPRPPRLRRARALPSRRPAPRRKLANPPLLPPPATPPLGPPAPLASRPPSGAAPLPRTRSTPSLSGWRSAAGSTRSWPRPETAPARCRRTVAPWKPPWPRARGHSCASFASAWRSWRTRAPTPLARRQSCGRPTRGLRRRCGSSRCEPRRPRRPARRPRSGRRARRTRSRLCRLPWPARELRQRRCGAPTRAWRRRAWRATRQPLLPAVSWPGATRSWAEPASRRRTCGRPAPRSTRSSRPSAQRTGWEGLVLLLLLLLLLRRGQRLRLPPEGPRAPAAPQPEPRMAGAAWRAQACRPRQPAVCPRSGPQTVGRKLPP